jgi:hypothetical protein
MGERALSPASTLAAVAEATDATRPDMMRTLTKDMLPDSSRRIELDDLVTEESNRVVAALRDESYGTGPIQGSANQQAGIVAKRAQDMWVLAEPFCTSLRVAARWGEPATLTPWITGLRRMVEASTMPMGGLNALTDLRRLPGTLAVMTSAIATIASRRWENLKALVVDPAVVHGRYGGTPIALLEVTDPYGAFRQGSAVAPMLSYAASGGRTIEEVLEELGDNKQMRSGPTPEFDWIFSILQPLFADQFPERQSWESEYERAEIFIGILAEDAYLMRPTNESGRRNRIGYWFGRAAQDVFRMDNSPVAPWAYELDRDAASWGPLQAGLFGGDLDRARAAVEGYAEQFSKTASQRW